MFSTNILLSYIVVYESGKQVRMIMTNKNEQTIAQTDIPLRLMDPKSDVVFKKIFGQHPELVKSFLNGILPLSEDRLIQTVDYLPSEHPPRIPSLKNTIVDVKCTDQEGRIFIVEMQMQWHMSFDKRLLYGASKAFVQQLEKGNSYSTLCPVYGLAIVNDIFDHKTQDWYHHYRFMHMKHQDKSLEGMELIFLELPKFIPQTLEHRRMGVLWLRFLNEINANSSTFPQEFKNIPELSLALELAQESAYTAAELEAYDHYLDALSVEQTVREDSFTEGKAEGEDNKARAVARNLIKLNIPLEHVAKATELNMEIILQLVKDIAVENIKKD